MSAGFSRALAIALVVLVVAMLWRFGAAPVWNAWQADRAAIETTREAIARFKGVAQSREALQQRLEAVRSNPALEGALMNASTATLAAAQLQQQLKATVESAGGSLVSSQVLDGAPEGPFVKVRVNTRMTLTVAQLQQVLYELEAQRPVLVVDELLILSRNRVTRRNATSVGETTLDVRAQFSGYMAGSEGDVPASSSRQSARLSASSRRDARRN